jgi:hypothetical protein
MRERRCCLVFLGVALAFRSKHTCESCKANVDVKKREIPRGSPCVQHLEANRVSRNDRSIVHWREMFLFFSITT